MLANLAAFSRTSASFIARENLVSIVSSSGHLYFDGALCSNSNISSLAVKLCLIASEVTHGLWSEYFVRSRTLKQLTRFLRSWLVAT